MALDTEIETAVVTLIAAAIDDVPCDARKILVLREDEDVPRIMVKCVYDRGQAGDSDHPINNFYTLIVRTVTRNNKAITGTEALKGYRQTIERVLYGPNLVGVSQVDDIRPTKPRMSAIPQLPQGIDSEVIQFEVETYEDIP